MVGKVCEESGKVDICTKTNPIGNADGTKNNGCNLSVFNDLKKILLFRNIRVLPGKRYHLHLKI